jgi:Secretion system C-terminal sorting domain
MVANCTFSSNHVNSEGGGAYFDDGVNSASLTNSIFWDNTPSNIGNGTGQLTVTYCNVQGGYTGTGNTNVNPLFLNAANPIGADGIWRTADDGLSLQTTSPAIDAATNTGSPTLDLLGNSIYNLTKDMGAYENQQGLQVYNGSAVCQSVAVNNVSGNQWVYFRHLNGIVAAINPNGLNLGTVIADISDPSDVFAFSSNKYLSRSINFTSSNYADGVTMPYAYTLRLYYYDSELSEYQTATSSSMGISDFNMAWRQGGLGCDLTTYGGNVNGIIAKTSLSTGEYGASNNGFYLQFPLNHFTLFAGTTSGTTVLPVELLNFSGYTEGGVNHLTWTTANEVNNKGFNVERLNPTTNTWVSMGFVNSKVKAAMYDFTDKNPFSVSYYRLRQIDNDGKETLSKVNSLSNTAKSYLKVYPNPAIDVLTVEFTPSTSARFETSPTLAAPTFEVLNVLGQIILRGPLNRSVDVAALPSGTYIVRVGLEQVKFVKQ